MIVPTHAAPYNNATRFSCAVHVVVLPWAAEKQIVPISATRGNTRTTFGDGRQHHDEANPKKDGNVGKGKKRMKQRLNE